MVGSKTKREGVTTKNNDSIVKVRVAHYPQVPCKPFEKIFTGALRGTMERACSAASILAEYDLFLEKNNHRVDYSSAQCLEVWNSDTKEWEDFAICWLHGLFDDLYEEEPRRWLAAYIRRTQP